MVYTQEQWLKAAEEAECACGSNSVDYGSITIDTASCYQRATCMECGLEWYENYQLTSVEVIK